MIFVSKNSVLHILDSFNQKPKNQKTDENIFWIYPDGPLEKAFGKALLDSKANTKCRYFTKRPLLPGQEETIILSAAYESTRIYEQIDGIVQETGYAVVQCYAENDGATYFTVAKLSQDNPQ